MTLKYPYNKDEKLKQNPKPRRHKNDYMFLIIHMTKAFHM